MIYMYLSLRKINLLKYLYFQVFIIVFLVEICLEDLVEWKYILMIIGVCFVIQIGVKMRLLFFVDKWGFMGEILQRVCIKYLLKVQCIRYCISVVRIVGYWMIVYIVDGRRLQMENVQNIEMMLGCFVIRMVRMIK